MKVIIKDDQGLGTALIMEDYSRAEIEDAKHSIRKQFKDAATMVFSNVLGKPLPETIVVDIAPDRGKKLEEDESTVLASFNSQLSRNDQLIFTVHEVTVKIALKESENLLLKSTIIHEMIHAADQSMLVNSRKLLDALRHEIYASSANFFAQNTNDALVALFNTMQMFEHYRAEGIAILGEHLLTKQRFDDIIDTMVGFRKVFEWTLVKSKNWALGAKSYGKIFDDNTYRTAYLVAPSILLLVLARMGLVDKALTIRAMEGLNSGDFGLTEEETGLIIRSSMSLSLSNYIHGVVSLGEKVAPAQPFLEFCALLQKEYEADSISTFCDLLGLPQTKEIFQTAMKQIMGCVMDEEEIDSHYTMFMANWNDETLYPQMKEKVEKLYGLLKNEVDAERKRIAQWALTYLFDDQDVIHDDIKGLGFVDDMAVLDYALEITTFA